MKKLWSVLCLLFVCMIMFSFHASANAPAPPSYLYIELSGENQEVEYVDVLAELTSESEGYISFSPRVPWPNDAPIVTYNQDGFVSLTTHLNGISENQRLTRSEENNTNGLILLPSAGQPLDKIVSRVKVALVNGSGEILHISPPVSIQVSNSDSFLRMLRYDVQTDTLTPVFANYYHGSSGSWTPNLWSALVRLLLSVGIELVIALLFRLRAVWKVAIVNLITQVLFIAFVFLSGQPYLFVVAIGEIIIYVAEFIAYILLYRHESWQKLLGYTVLANTVTLIMGLLFNRLGWLL